MTQTDFRDNTEGFHADIVKIVACEQCKPHCIYIIINIKRSIQLQEQFSISHYQYLIAQCQSTCGCCKS